MSSQYYYEGRSSVCPDKQVLARPGWARILTLTTVGWAKCCCLKSGLLTTLLSVALFVYILSPQAGTNEDMRKRILTIRPSKPYKSYPYLRAGLKRKKATVVLGMHEDNLPPNAAPKASFLNNPKEYKQEMNDSKWKPKKETRSVSGLNFDNLKIPASKTVSNATSMHFMRQTAQNITAFKASPLNTPRKNSAPNTNTKSLLSSRLTAKSNAMRRRASLHFPNTNNGARSKTSPPLNTSASTASNQTGNYPQGVDSTNGDIRREALVSDAPTTNIETLQLPNVLTKNKANWLLRPFPLDTPPKTNDKLISSSLDTGMEVIGKELRTTNLIQEDKQNTPERTRLSIAKDDSISLLSRIITSKNVDNYKPNRDPRLNVPEPDGHMSYVQENGKPVASSVDSVATNTIHDHRASVHNTRMTNDLNASPSDKSAIVMS